MKKLFTVLLFIAAHKMAMAQNVGIGTTTPSEKLQVAGNIKADTVKPNAIKLTSNAGTGKILTSDATGNANWQTSSAAAAGNVGFGGWGDCSVQNISGYNPVVATDGLNGDNFGNSVSISGNFAIIGAFADNVGVNADQGAAYIFFFNGLTWVQFQKLTAIDGASGDLFGIDVSISGNYAIVGAPSNDVTGADQGSAYYFFFNGAEWELKQIITAADGAAGDAFGNSVCIKDNRLIIGAPNDDAGLNTDLGSAYIYAFSGANFILERHITAGDGAAGDQFGRSVGIDGVHAVIGAPLDDVSGITDQGSVYIFSYNGTTWLQQGKFSRTAFPAASDNFGSSVSISPPYCVIGEPNYGTTNKGAIHLLIYTFGFWIYHQEINPPILAAGSVFTGRDVFISDDYLITGASGEDVNGIDGAGKVFIYKNLGGLWRLYEDFTDPAAGSVDAIGSSVAIDNNRFVTGSGLPPNQNQRGVAVFGKIE